MRDGDARTGRSSTLDALMQRLGPTVEHLTERTATGWRKRFFWACGCQALADAFSFELLRLAACAGHRASTPAASGDATDAGEPCRATSRGEAASRGRPPAQRHGGPPRD